MNDHELLHQFIDQDSEDAFRQLVERHGGLVYSVAMRQLRQPHQAEEIAHAVFVALAKKAGRLQNGTILAGWLFRATRFAVAKFQRDEQRRQRREKEAAMMAETASSSDSDRDWEQIVPVLDEELAGLGEKERGAVLLRFFQDRSFKEVGEALGTSEDAAKMRVSRALDKLRQRFLKRGLVLSATALVGAFGSQAMAATATAPPGLAEAVTKAWVGKSVSSTLVESIVRKLTWWRWKRVVFTVSGVLTLGLVILLSFRMLNAPATPPPNAAAWPAQR